MKLSRTIVSIAAVAALVAVPGAAFADSHVAGDDVECSNGEAPDYGGVCPDEEVKPTPKPTPAPAPTQKVIRTLQTR